MRDNETQAQKDKTMADYDIYVDDFGRFATAYKNPGPFSTKIIAKDFSGSTFKADAIRWIKRCGGKQATFRFVKK